MGNLCKGLKELKIIKYNNPEIIGDYTRYNNCEFQPILDPGSIYGYAKDKLKLLREKYCLDDVVEKGKSDFEKLVLLRKWVNKRWKYGFSAEPSPKSINAFDILEAADNGATFACGVYAGTFMQCCISLGFPARFVSILRDKSDIPEPENAFFTGHCVTEVWSNDFQKWVVFDPTADWHYEGNGIPLNSYEIRKAWLCGKESNIRQVPSVPVITLSDDDAELQVKGFYNVTSKMYGKEFADKYISNKELLNEMWERFTKNKSMHFYTHIIINTAEKSYYFADKLVEPILLVNEYPIQRAWPKLQWTGKAEDAYFSLNQTRIELKVEDNQQNFNVIVKLTNTDPYFEHYIVKINGNNWRTEPEEFKWKLNEGCNTILACTVNKYGRRGIVSSITIRRKQ